MGKLIKRAQRQIRKAEKHAGRAERVEGRIEARRERRPEAHGQRFAHMEKRAERLRGKEAQHRGMAERLAPGLGATATAPTEPIQDTGGGAGGGYTTDPVTQPYSYTNPRPPYEGGPTIQQQATPGTEATIAPYYTGAGPLGQRYEDWLNTEYNQIEGRTTDRFADMFSKYVDVANREAGRQSAQIGESLGSRGALYSSANLGQQADLRQRTSQDIALQGANFQTELENQRQRAYQTVLQGMGGAASAEYGAREAGMGRAWQDFLRTSDLPPEYAAGTQWASQRPGQGHYAKY